MEKDNLTPITINEVSASQLEIIARATPDKQDAMLVDRMKDPLFIEFLNECPDFALMLLEAPDFAEFRDNSPDFVKALEGVLHPFSFGEVKKTVQQPAEKTPQPVDAKASSAGKPDEAKPT